MSKNFETEIKGGLEGYLSRCEETDRYAAFKKQAEDLAESDGGGCAEIVLPGLEEGEVLKYVLIVSGHAIRRAGVCGRMDATLNKEEVFAKIREFLLRDNAGLSALRTAGETPLFWDSKAGEALPENEDDPTGSLIVREDEKWAPVVRMGMQYILVPTVLPEDNGRYRTKPRTQVFHLDNDGEHLWLKPGYTPSFRR